MPKYQKIVLIHIKQVGAFVVVPHAFVFLLQYS